MRYLTKTITASNITYQFIPDDVAGTKPRIESITATLPNKIDIQGLNNPFSSRKAPRLRRFDQSSSGTIIISPLCIRINLNQITHPQWVALTDELVRYYPAIEPFQLDFAQYNAKIWPSTVPIPTPIEQPTTKTALEHLTGSQPMPPRIAGLRYRQLPGDGHCFYHAVGLYLGLDQQQVRHNIAQYIDSHRDPLVDTYIQSVGKTHEQYIADVLTDEWADHIEIGILSTLINRPIVIIALDGTVTNAIDVCEHTGDPIFLLYDGVLHYDVYLLEPGHETHASDILANLLLAQLRRAHQPSLITESPLDAAVTHKQHKAIVHEALDIADTAKSTPSATSSSPKSGRETQPKRKVQFVEPIGTKRPVELAEHTPHFFSRPSLAKKPTMPPTINWGSTIFTAGVVFFAFEIYLQEKPNRPLDASRYGSISGLPIFFIVMGTLMICTNTVIDLLSKINHMARGNNESESVYSIGKP